jgi:hypothetical protein
LKLVLVELIRSCWCCSRSGHGDASGKEKPS